MSANSNNSTKSSQKAKTSSKPKNSKTLDSKNTKKSNEKVIAQKQAFGDSLVDEIILICLILFSIIMAISMFSQSMGFFGGLIRTLLTGLFGFSGYIVPFVICIFSGWVLASGQRSFVPLKIVGSILLIIFISTLAQSIGGVEVDSVTEFWKNGSATNGGFLGGVIDLMLNKVFGAGRYIVIVALIIISFIMATGKSLIEGIVSAKTVYDIRKKQKNEKIKSKAETIKIREQELERRYIEKQEKMQYKQAKRKKNTGSSFNIKLNQQEGLKTIEPKVEEPVVEVPQFKSVPIEKPVAQEKIYDYNKVLDEYREEPIQIFKSKKEALEDTIVNLAVSELLKAFDASEINEDDILKQIQEETLNMDFDEDTNKTDEVLISGEEAESQIEINFKKSKSDEVSDYAQIENVTVEVPDVVEEKADEIRFEEPKADIPKIEESSTEEIKEENYDDIELVHGDGTNPLEGFNSGEDFVESTDAKEIVQEAEKQANLKPLEKPTQVKPEYKYVFPPINLLGKNTQTTQFGSKEEMISNAKKLEETLLSFGVEAKVVQINKGPTVTRYELSPSQGVKVSKIVNLADDIALNLAAQGIRIEAPIPGKAAVGIEVPNQHPESVYLRDVLESDEFKNFPSKVAFALGEDIAGNAIVTDIAKMPHLLIAGATGSGKSVCINTLITSILYKAKPDEVKLLLIDPKVVELSIYNGIPHLLIPVVTDPKKASGALNWAVREMLARYQSFADNSVRDIKGYNAMKKEKNETDLMPQIVIVIDELADLMMAAPGEVEDSVCRLAQMARAAGIHLIIATQRPSVDVITGVIKANIPSRMAFAVSSGIDSRTILDSVGAEKLLGKGDMLFSPVGMSKPVRIQGAFVTDKEVESLVSFLKSSGKVEYDEAMIDEITSPTGKQLGDSSDSDEFFTQAVELVIEKEKASVSMLQRQFRIGYNRAARLMDDLESRGIVGPEDGSKPRKVLMTQAEFDEYMA